MNTKATKDVEVTFDPRDIGVSLDDTRVFGIDVVKKGKKLVGTCDPAVAKSMKASGRCE